MLMLRGTINWSNCGNGCTPRLLYLRRSRLISTHVELSLPCQGMETQNTSGEEMGNNGLEAADSDPCNANPVDERPKYNPRNLPKDSTLALVPYYPSAMNRVLARTPPETELSLEDVPMEMMRTFLCYFLEQFAAHADEICERKKKTIVQAIDMHEAMASVLPDKLMERFLAKQNESLNMVFVDDYIEIEDEERSSTLSLCLMKRMKSIRKMTVTTTTKSNSRLEGRMYTLSRRTYHQNRVSVVYRLEESQLLWA